MNFNEYPYINLQDVNLDWILKHIKEIEANLKDFVKLNTIKYAVPITWNITTQYETNTVVLDGNTGTAYISVQPVPAGVALTNSEYWTVVFTLNLTTSNQNITLRDDGTNVVATFASDTGDWLLWNFYLYKVTQPISVNTAYVVGFNLERYTVELFIKDYINNLISITEDLQEQLDDHTSDITNLSNDKVDKATIAPIENEISVINSYSIGDYFYKDNVLYRALTPIMTGTIWTALTLDTNYETVTDTLTENINTLNNYINLLNDNKTEKSTIAAIENDNTVNGNLNAGDYFYRNNSLYKAIQNITAGTAWNTLVINTDYESVTDTLTDMINALNDNKTEKSTIASIENNNTVNSNLNTGDYFYRNNSLYKAIRNITAGTAWNTLVINTDYESVTDTLTDMINDCNDRLDSIKNNYVLSGDNWCGITTTASDTFATAFDKLLAQFESDMSTISDDHYIAITNMYVPSYGNLSLLNRPWLKPSAIKAATYPHQHFIAESFNAGTTDIRILANLLGSGHNTIVTTTINVATQTVGGANVTNNYTGASESCGIHYQIATKIN